MKFWSRKKNEATAREMVARARADEYASCLQRGDFIIEDIDGDYIAPFRQYLPAALARRGLAVEEIRGGWKVVAVGKLADESATAPLWCLACKASWFNPDCEHASLKDGHQGFKVSDWPQDAKGRAVRAGAKS